MLCHVRWQTVPDILEERASEIPETIHKFTECNDSEDTNIHPHSYHNSKALLLSFSWNLIPSIIIQYKFNDSENTAGPAGCAWLRVPLIKAGCDMMHNKWHITTTLWVAQLKHSLNFHSRNIRRSAPTAQLVKNGCDMTYIHTSQPFWLAGHRHWLQAVM